MLHPWASLALQKHNSNYKTLIHLTIFFTGGFSQPMDAAQMFKAFFGNGNGAGMHHAFHHHFGFGSNNASNMPGGAFFQFTQELYILTYCLVYICTIFLRFIEIQTGFLQKENLQQSFKPTKTITCGSYFTCHKVANSRLQKCFFPKRSQ